jgi:hypothetical protein
LEITLFGNGGRWLGTILLCIGYAFASSPQGLILAKRFITSDFKSVANWFPGVYFTAAAIPYIIYSSLLQALPDADKTILIVGDVLSIAPQVAFPRGLGALIELSSKSKDPNLSCMLMDFVAYTLHDIFALLVLSLVTIDLKIVVLSQHFHQGVMFGSLNLVSGTASQ